MVLTLVLVPALGCRPFGLTLHHHLLLLNVYATVNVSQLWVCCNAATINFYVQPFMVFLSHIDTFWIHNCDQPMWQLVPNEGHLREHFQANVNPQIEPSLTNCSSFGGILWPTGSFSTTVHHMNNISHWDFHLSELTLPASTVFTMILSIQTHFLK